MTTCNARVTEYGDRCVMEAGHAGNHRIDFGRARGKGALTAMLEAEEEMTMTTYTGLSDDQRACWDAMVAECKACQATDDDEPCDAHDLEDLDESALNALIADWQAGDAS